MKLFRHTFTSKARRASSHEINPEDVFLDSENVSNLNIHQLEGQLEKPISRRAFAVTSICLTFIIFIFLFKLFSLQIINNDFYSKRAENNSIVKIPIFALRGNIVDRNGDLLAYNVLGTTTENIPKRMYTDKEGFSHLLGYVDYPKKDKSGFFWQTEYIGKDGVELIYQDLLSGTKGERLISVDVNRNIIGESVVSPPVNGSELKLTIDAKVQEKLFEEIKTLANGYGFTGGSGIIMDVNNGEVLAMASYPEYNNNLMTNQETKEDKEQIRKDLDNKNHKFLNRVISGLFTPGSTVKPFFALAALNEDIIKPEVHIFSSGALVIKNKYGGPDTVFKDWKAHGYVDMREAIAVSSDEYFYQIGGGYKDQEGLGIERIDKYSKMIGFDSETGIDLPNEQSGIIPTPEWKKKVFGEDWLLGNTYHTSIGQYGFQITPIELVRAVSLIANGGYMVTPHVYKGKEGVRLKLNFKEKDIEIVKEGMRLSVTGGIGGALKIDGVKVASKSGTAELGVKKDLVNSWISGFFPYDNPRYAFVVIMEKGSVNNLHGAVFAMKDTIEWMRDNTEYTK